MFIQIHTLRSFPPHIPNRDGSGLAKRAFFGGVERQRISYQCHQHAVKSHALIEEMNNKFGETLRSRMIGDRYIRPILSLAGFTEEENDAWASAIMSLWNKKKKKKEEDEGGGEGEDRGNENERGDESSKQVMVVGKKEADALANIVISLRGAGIEPGILYGMIESISKGKQLKPLIKKILPNDTADVDAAISDVEHAISVLRNLRANTGFDGALFGRMATGVAVSTVRRAVRFSDWLTTHAITSVSDFFATTDMLKDDEDDAGGAHINNRELGAGLFYQHAVIDVRQLQDNLGVDSVADVACWLIDALSKIDPVNGRANSSLVEMGIQIGLEQPRTLMDAFSRPTPPNDAVAALHAFAESQDRLDGLGSPKVWASRDGVRGVLEFVKSSLSGQAA